MPSTSHADSHDRSGSPDAQFPDVLSPYFTGLVLDDAPQLLEDSYKLRYQVYCVERRFLPVEEYPGGLEVDGFDRHAIHVGVVNTQGDVVATARLVQPSEAGLPLFDHCSIFPHEISLDPARRVVELSRLSVSRRYNRRAGDEFYSLQGPSARPDGPERRGEGENRGGGEIVLALYKALYQASKRRGHTHWFAATERSLQRLVTKYGIPFRAIGPEVDYYGKVAPYLVDLHEWDRVISSRRISLLDDFLTGLEPEFRPVDDHAGPSGRAAR